MLIDKLTLSVSEAASILNCSSQTIYRLIHNKSLNAYKDLGGRPWHIPDYSIRNYIFSRMNARN